MPFDPSKPFETEKKAKGGFDPSKPFESDGKGFEAALDDGKEVEPKSSDLKAGVMGAVSGVTMGWYDEAMGGLNAGVEKLKQQFGPEVTGSPDFMELYAKERDKIRAELKQLEKDHPNSFTAGEVFGGVAGALIPGGLAARGLGALTKGAALASKIGAGVKGAALTGGVAGAGYSEEEDLLGVAQDVGKGAALGAVAGGLAKGAGALGKAATDKIITGSRANAMKALGFSGKHLDDMSPERQGELLEFAKKQKILTINPVKSQKNADKLLEEAGKDLDGAFGRVEVDLVDTEEMVDALQSKVLSKYDLKVSKEVHDAVQGSIEDIIDIGTDPKAVRNFRTRLGESIEIAKKQNRPDIVQAHRQTFAILAEHMKEKVEATGNKELVDAYKNYHLASQLKSSIDRVARTEANRPGMMKKYITSPYQLAQFAALASASPGLAVGKAAIDQARRKLGPVASVKLQKAIEGGGAKAQELMDLVSKGKFDRLAIKLGTKAIVEPADSRKKDTRDLLKTLKMPK